MNALPRTLLALPLALLTAAALGQEKPPPWWGVQHEVGISLFWNFDTPFVAGQPPAPTAVVAAAPWYNPAETSWTAPANAVWIPTLNGHVGVLGLVGGGAPTSALLKLKVDNDPHLDWVKIFWFQFDAFEGSSGDIKKAIEQDLANYKRSTVTEKVESLGNGWERITVEAQLYPQPDDETIEWTFLENAFGTVGIDNLYVNSKCVQPGADEKGKALGERDGPILDLLQVTGTTCTAVAVVEGPAPTFTRSYWVATRGATTTTSHTIVQLNTAGTVLQTTTLPDNGTTVPLGPGDLTVADLPVAAGTTQRFVYALVDRRPAGGNVVLEALNLAGSLVPARDVVLAGFPLPTGQPFGLTYESTGNLGNGTFWITGNDGGGQGQAVEVSRTGLVLDVRPVPSDCVGLGYDEDLGYFYGFSRALRASPNGPVRVNGFEWSGYDFQTTGVQFCGDLTIPNGAGPRGGVAASLDAYRPSGTPTSELRLACVVDVPAQGRQFLYELAAPFRFGWSQFGRCGMRGGAPFLGNTGWQVTLTGVPDAVAASIVLGFSNTNYLGVPLPIDLAVLGMPESWISVAMDVTGSPVLPSAVGEFTMPVPIPSSAALAYAPTFFQWILLDPNVPGLLVASTAGKTVLYP